MVGWRSWLGHYQRFFGAPSARIFEAAASCSVIISDKNPFIVKEFGDSVLYIDDNGTGEDLFNQVDAHVQWIFSHPEEAEILARKAYAIFIEKFTLEKQLLNLSQLHESVMSTKSDLLSYVVDDREDWSSRQDFLDGKIRILSLGLEEEPENESRIFYLAQAYKIKGMYQEAIQWYKKRLEVQGNEEEKWYSKFKLGEVYESLDDWKLALQWYLKAYHSDSSRAEPLQKIASYYRKNGQYALAYHFAKLGGTIPFPKNKRLFIYPSVYAYQFDEEISIVAYYLNLLDEGLSVSNRLMLNESVPPYIKEQVSRNIVFYTRK